MLCPKCNQQNDDRAMYCQSCGTVLGPKPTPVSTSTVQSQSTVSYGGFWLRFVALIIDSLIISVASGVLALATFGAGIAVALVGPWLYEAFMLSSEWQATVGKRAMGLAVTGIDGGRISFARGTGRHFAKYISACLLGIGFIMAAFTAKKQALHDMIAETLVVKRVL
jgi:uncharacterized RDD family membrane protein YckC